MDYNDAKKNLYTNYRKYGVTKELIDDLMESGIQEGFSVNMVYNGLRMAMAQQFEEHELFSIEDVMEITGETREEVIKRIEDMRTEVKESGENPDDYAFEVPSQARNTFFLPEGIDTKEYSNGKLEGSLKDIEECIELLTRVHRDADYPEEYLKQIVDSIYGQFHVPENLRKAY